MAQANVKLTVDGTSAIRSLQGVQTKTTQLQKSFGVLKTAVAGIGFTALAKQSVQISANFQKLTVRLGLLTKESGNFQRSLELVSEAQRTFGLSSTEALDGITNITARLQPLGVSLEDIKTTFFGFNTAAKLSGATAIESSNAFRQLAQALGSGRLQGDEFRSISEQIPTILKPVADELGTTVGELKKFSSEGKITSGVVIRALKKIETEGGKSLAALLKNDPTQVFKNLSNETENLARAFGDRLTPVLLPVIRGLTEVTKAIADFLNSGAGQVSLIFTGIALAIKGVTVVTPLIIGQLSSMAISMQVSAANSVLAATGLKGLGAASFVAAGGITKMTIALSVLKVALIKTGIGAVVVGLGLLAAKFIDNKNATLENAKAQEEFNRQLGILKDDGGEIQKIIDQIAEKQKKLNEQRIRPASKKRIREDIKELETTKKILEGEKERSELERINAKFNDQTIDSLKKIRILEEQINGKTVEQITLEDKIAQIKNEFSQEDAEQLINLLKQEESLKRKLDLIKKNKDEAEKLKEKFKQIGVALEENIKDNLKEAIKGAQSFGDAMNNVLNKIKDQLLDLALDELFKNFQRGFNKEEGDKGGVGGIIGSIIGGIFNRENGGPVKAGQPYIVGERQPELFIPNRSGTIIPSVASGGDSITNIVNVSVDATGSTVQGNQAGSQELGQTIALVVQETLVREKRSGGLLA